MVVGVSSPELLDAAAVEVATAAPDAGTSPVEVSPDHADAGAIEQRAWEALSLADDARAEELFATVLNVEPGNARARAGYGIAAALAGREATAAWALGDSMSLRPAVLDDLPLSTEARWRITELARHLEAQAIDSPGSGDALFLTAALRASVGDRAQAAYAMNRAALLGPLDDVRTNFRARLTAGLN